jgi:beta-1,4-mannosyltransferase
MSLLTKCILNSLMVIACVTLIVVFICRKTYNTSKRIAVLVLGDIGRSPRMQNHAVSLAKAGWNVDLIGFKGTLEHEAIH